MKKDDGTTLHESGGVVQPTDAQIDALRDHYKALGFPVDWYRAFARAVLALAVPQAPLQAEPVPVVASNTLTDTYVQRVPDKCDRILWRNNYYHLPIKQDATPQAEPAVAEQAHEAQVHAGIMALLQCTSSEVENLSPKMLDTYTDEVTRVYVAMSKRQAQSPPPPESAGQGLSDAARDVLAERHRQISVEGWTPEHDDEHSTGSMAIASACYALSGLGMTALPLAASPVRLWGFTGWSSEWWKPKDRRSNLVRSAALVMAEIERLDRAAILAANPKAQPDGGSKA